MAVNIILDTDLGTDVDDVGDLALCVSYHKSGQANLLAVITDVTYPYAAPCTAAMLAYSLPGVTIPVGSYNGTVVIENSSVYAQQVASRFGKPGDINTNYPGHVATYRTALAAAANASVVIIMTGNATPIADLLKSPADSISTLTGAQLVAQKVKQIVWEAGWNPTSTTQPPNAFAPGPEYNINLDIASAQYLVANLPAGVPLAWAGDEIGFNSATSGNPNDPLVAGPVGSLSTSRSPYAYAYSLYAAANPGNGVVNGYYSRPAWGQVAVHYGILGLTSFFSIGGASGTMSIAANGNNTWTATAGPHSYLSLAAAIGTVSTQFQHQIFAAEPTRAPFSPLNVAGCALWIDPSDASTITQVSNRISQISDKSGGGVGGFGALTQATATAQPTLTANAINGLPAVSFVKTSQQALVSAANTTMAADGTFFVVAKHSGGNVGGAWVKIGDSTSNGYALGAGGAQFDNVGDNLTGLSENYAWISTTDAIGAGTTVCGCFVAAAANVTLYTDGTQQSTSAVSYNAPSLAQYGGYSGSNLGAAVNRFSNDIIGEVLFYNGIMTTADRQSIEGYLAWKWGTVAALPANHPYKNAPPGGAVSVSATLVVRATAAKTASASLTVRAANVTTAATRVQYAVANSTTATLNVTLATAPVAGHLLVAVQSTSGYNGSFTTPAGWSVLAGPTLTVNNNTIAFWKTASGTEGTSLAFTGHDNDGIAVYEVSGAAAGAPVAAFTSDAASTVTVTFAAESPTRAGSLVLEFVAPTNGGDSATVPTGYTGETYVNVPYHGVHGYYLANPAVGTNCAQNSTLSPSDDWDALIVLIAPASSTATISASSSLTVRASAAISRAATAVVKATAAVSRTASAVVRASASRTIAATLTIAAVSSVALPATLRVAATSSTTSSATLTARATKTLTVPASLTVRATQTLTAPATLTARTTAATAAPSTLTVKATNALTSSATLRVSVASSVTVPAALTARTTGTLATPATLRASNASTVTVPATLTVKATNAVSTPASITVSAIAAKTANATLVASAKAVITAPATLRVASAGSITALATLTVRATSAVTAPATLTASVVGTGTIQRNATLTVRATNTTSASASLTAKATNVLTAFATLRISNATSVTAPASLTVRATSALSAPATLVTRAQSAVTAPASLVIRATAANTASASLAVKATNSLAAPATLSARTTGTVSAPATLAVSTMNSVTAPASLTVRATQSLTAPASLVAQAKAIVTASATLRVAATQSLTAPATLVARNTSLATVPATLTVRTTGVVTAPASFAVRAMNSLIANASLTARAMGVVTAPAALVVGATGLKTAPATLVARATQTFTAPVTLRVSNASSAPVSATLVTRAIGIVTAPASLTAGGRGSVTAPATLTVRAGALVLVNALLKADPPTIQKVIPMFVVPVYFSLSSIVAGEVGVTLALPTNIPLTDNSGTGTAVLSLTPPGAINQTPHQLSTVVGTVALVDNTTGTSYAALAYVTRVVLATDFPVGGIWRAQIVVTFPDANVRKSGFFDLPIGYTIV